MKDPLEWSRGSWDCRAAIGFSKADVAFLPAGSVLACVMRVSVAKFTTQVSYQELVRSAVYVTQLITQ